MSRLNEDDVLEIIEMLENEIIRIAKASRIEKMRYKTKIRNQVGWLGALVNPTPKKIIDKLSKRMAELFYQLPGGLSNEFKEFLDEKVNDWKTTFPMRAYG